MQQTVLITGGSSGIGKELARLFAADGYEVVITARRRDRLEEVQKELVGRFGASVHIVAMDLASPSASDRLWQEVSKVVTRVDVLVNNAGFGSSERFLHTDPLGIENLLSLNVTTLTQLTRRALPSMIKARRGRILNVASVASFQPGGPGMTVYYATKSYVLSFSRGLGRELAGTGVSVTALCPGPTNTEFEHAAGAEGIRLFRWLGFTSVQSVAKAGFRGMQAGRKVVIPGIANLLLAHTPRFTPAAVVLRINEFLLAKR